MSPVCIRPISLAWMVVQLVCLTGLAQSEVNVHVEATDGPGAFVFPKIKTPAMNDAGSLGKWSVMYGQADANSGSLQALNDGKVPADDDSPAENFFFAAGTEGGSLVVDLGSVQEIDQIVTYSRHAGTRAPQVFTVLAATGQEPGFSLTADKKSPPTQEGWKVISKVDTRKLSRNGSQHAASITSDQSILGEFRYLRFDVTATETRDPFGNTFFSEIDILTKGGPEVRRLPRLERQEITFDSPDKRFHFTIDSTVAPDLREWSEMELKPVIEQWYAKIVDMLPSDDFKAPTQVRFQFLPSDKMRGIPAWAQSATISMNAGWFRSELKREARGAVVHEMVHVVQHYQRAGRGRRAPPGWLIEGIPDYIRWFLYEPETNGAALSKQALAQAKHDASYRTTGNFIDWVIRTYDSRGDLLKRLNAIARQGKYSSETWNELTGKTENELADEWRAQ